MKRKIKYLLLLILVIVLSNCKKKEVIALDCVEIQDLVSFNLTESFDISIDSFPQEFSYESITFDPTLGYPILVAYNLYDHTIARFDLSRNKKLATLILEEEGPDKIPLTFEDFYYVSEDMLYFLVDEGIGTIYEWKKKGVDRFRINSGNYALGADPAYNMRFTYRKEDRSFLVYLFHQEIFEENPKYYNHPVVGVVDLKTRTLIKTIGSYPYPNTDKALGYDIIPSMVAFKDRIVLAFGGVDNLTNFPFNFDKSTLPKVKSFCANFPGIKVNLGKIDEGWDFQQRRNFFNQKAFFMNLYYDPYRKLYYRLVKHSQGLKNSEGKLNSFFDAKWSILILDDAFNRIGVSNFNSQTYNPYSLLIAPNGIYIRNRNREKETNSSWDLFTIDWRATN